MDDATRIRRMQEAARLCEEAAARCNARSEDHNHYVQEAAAIRAAIEAFESERTRSLAYESLVLRYVDRYRPGHSNPAIEALRRLHRDEDRSG
jgi:hypothetical protein